MREIKFRGKRLDNGEWAYGSLVINSHMGDVRYYIATDGMAQIYVTAKEVLPATIGQFTGLTDKNGKEIYEGDILEFITERKYGFQCDGVKARFCVEFGKFNLRNDTLYDFIGFHTRGSSIEYRLQYGCEVISNIHDNPELIHTEKGGGE